jgi:hypothetical protein
MITYQTSGSYDTYAYATNNKVLAQFECGLENNTLYYHPQHGPSVNFGCCSSLQIQDHANWKFISRHLLQVYKQYQL